MTKRVLITGATDGIGLALARRYAALGYELLLLGRRPLSQLEDPLFTPERYLAVDLSQDGAAAKLAEGLAAHGAAALDLVIHNAGTGYHGPVADQPAASIEQVLAVNLYAPIQLTQTLLPVLRRAGGRLVFIGSVSSVLPAPEYATYVATKAALSGFARSLRVELAGEVAVLVIHPGATRTGMHAKLGISTEKMDWRRFPAADVVAQQIMAAIDSGRPEATIGAMNRLLRLTGRYARPLLDGALRLGRRGARRAPEGQPVCAITGAADGIGRALALQFAAAGWAIIGIDIDAERGAGTQAELHARGARATFLEADLSTIAGVERTAALLDEAGPLDLLVHNAGINAVGRFAKVAWSDQSRVLDLNLRAPLLLTAALLHQGVLAPGAGLIFLSSLSHFTGYPGAAVYSATKDGLFAYARCLDVALAERGGRTLTVFPGPTRTVHARRYSPDNSREGRRMPPETVAAAVARAYRRRRRVVIPGMANQALAALGRLAPRTAEAAMKRAILVPLDRVPKKGK